jgi:penicillin amidase
MAWQDIVLYPVIGPLLKAGLGLLGRTRLPQTQGKLRLRGLAAPVDVLRDSWGVPHIYAASPRDAVFAQGFVHAQERLWQMDFTRRVVAGRLAEVLGEAALPFDRAMRTLGLRLVAEQEAALVPEPLASLLQAYASGVNECIELAAQRRALPIEFTLLGYRPEPWQPADTLSWSKLMGWSLAGNWQSEFLRGQIVQRLGAEKAAELEVDADAAWAVILDAGRALAGGKPVDATRPFTGPGPSEGVGSNNWVVHGLRTASSKPILANDMHLGLTTPSIWFENHLVGGDLEATGVSFPGVPLVVAGHNRHVAWGFTDGMADVQDLYEEHLRRAADGGWEYEFQGEWLPATVRREQIAIKGGKSSVEEVVVTRHGPVINALFKDAFPEAPPLALRWTALEPETTLQAFYGMNMAQDCQQFREALRLFTGPAQNTVYADIKGDIAYTLPGKIPIRARGDGSLPSPGWTGEYEWVGYIPFEDLPHLENPPRGYVATANNPVHRPDFSCFIARDFCSSDRAARITELLEARIGAGKKVDVAYVKKMQFDQLSISARALARCLGALEVTDADLRPVVERMRAWDGTLAASSPDAAVFEVTIRRALHLILEHQLGNLAPHVQGQGPTVGLWGDRCWEWFSHLLEKPASPWFDLGHGEKRDDVLLLALRQAVDFLKEKLGPEVANWQWGKLHQLTFGHVLGQRRPLDVVFNLGPYPVGGDGSTIWATLTSQYDLNKGEVVGPPFRFIADLSDLDHCWGLLAPGQSGHRASPHYSDGVPAWFNAGYHPMLVRREEVELHLEGWLELEAAPRS